MPKSQSFPGIETDYPDLAEVPVTAEVLIVADGKDYNATPAQLFALGGALSGAAIVDAIDDELGSDDWQQGGGGGGGDGGLLNIVEDVTPQLGGDLDLNGYTVGAANVDDLLWVHQILATSQEVNYLEGVTGNVQAQIDAKSATTHTHPATGISDSTEAGRALLTAATVEAQQTLLGIVGEGNFVPEFILAANDPVLGPQIGAAVGDAMELVPTGAARTVLGDQMLLSLLEATDRVLTVDDMTDMATAMATIGIIVASAAAPMSVRFLEDTDNGSNYVELAAPASIASNVTHTLPTTAGVLARVAAATGVPAASDVDDVAPTALTDGATITPDFSLNRNFTLTIGGNRTLANPTNQVAGRSGLIVVTQDGTGSRTLAYGANWKFPGGAPTLTTTASAVDIITYFVVANGTIYANLLKAFA
jgi:hypothetical protein